MGREATGCMGCELKCCKSLFKSPDQLRLILHFLNPVAAVPFLRSTCDWGPLPAPSSSDTPLSRHPNDRLLELGFTWVASCLSLVNYFSFSVLSIFFHLLSSNFTWSHGEGLCNQAYHYCLVLGVAPQYMNDLKNTSCPAFFLTSDADSGGCGSWWNFKLNHCFQKLKYFFKILSSLKRTTEFHCVTKSTFEIFWIRA